jgi:hypothetical protein
LAHVKSDGLPVERKPTGILIGSLDLDEIPGSGLDAEPGRLCRGAPANGSPAEANPATFGLTELPATSPHADL